jgi:hypothetical protein
VPDQILLPVKARQITETAIKARVGCAWIIIDDDADYPGAVIARFATHSPSVYVMVAATLDELRAMLPPGLIRSLRQPGDPLGVIEIWFSPP